MPLKLKKLEEVEIGEFKAVPVVTAESLLRLSQANAGTAEGRKEVVRVMAECFPDRKDDAQEIIDALPIFELCRLQAYLIGGDDAVVALNRELLRETSLKTEVDNG